MKKTILGLMAYLLLILTVPMHSQANETSRTKSAEEISASAIVEAKADINKMSIRLEEINKIDIESISKTEKKELRKEVRNIKNELSTYSKSDSVAANSNGLYISGGALIIIILLIILL